MKIQTIVLTGALALGALTFDTLTSQTFNTNKAAANEQEYCISGPSSKLVTLREKGSESSQEAGLGRGGDCGMFVVKCTFDWCKMQMHDFEGWVKRVDLRKK